jgi:ABC-type sugar transport system permease subunit
MIYQVPVIVIFSLFIAIILNQKFFGRTFVRATFFLPVIIASGVVISIIKGDFLSQAMMSTTSVSHLFSTTFLNSLLSESGIPYSLTSLITTTVDNMFELIWKSGIQILIFLAGLQTIHVSQYEAAKIEGATGWEIFWKITFPMISPITILNVMYTIIDSFRDYSNPVINQIATSTQQLKLEFSLAMSWSYFAFVIFVIACVYVVINRYVFYQV